MPTFFRLHALPQVVCLLVLMLLGACESPRPMIALEPSKKAELERLFFNEMVSIYFAYPGSSFADKKAYLQSLSDQGLELAGIALQLNEAVGGDDRARAPYQRLDELVKQGDLGAMCFYDVHPDKWKPVAPDPRTGIDRAAYREQIGGVVRRGAMAGHPACKARMVASLLDDHSISEAKKMALEAGREGYLRGYVSMAFFYGGALSDPNTDMERAYCWEAKAVALNVPSYKSDSLLLIQRMIESRRYQGRLNTPPKRFDENCELLGGR